MKIIQKSKRGATPHPQVAVLINKLADTPTSDLPQVLAEIDSWRWPRSDLNAWVRVLNKFDAALEACITEYAVDKIQLKAFEEGDKKVLCEILRFERLLLENSTNRKLFNSYDRINALLSTSDLDVLVLALNLLLRPAQQYSAQPSVSQALSISTPRLISLAKRWPASREHVMSLVDLADGGVQGAQKVDSLPPEARQVNFSFYRKDAAAVAAAATAASPVVRTTAPSADADPFTTPHIPSASVPTITQTPQPTTSQTPSSSQALAASSSQMQGGAVNVHIDTRTLDAKPPMQVLSEAVQQYNVPDEECFELCCRIRAAAVLAPSASGSHDDDEAKRMREERQKLVTVRLLAIAIFCHTHSETQAQSSLFLYEPDLTAHVAELLASPPGGSGSGLSTQQQAGGGFGIGVQVAAIAALDAIAHYRNKVQDVLGAVNAGVNHGILMALLRRTVSDVAHPESDLPHAFVEALLSFVTFLASHQMGGSMLVAAGLVPVLVQIVENRIPHRLGVVSKTMQLMDNVLYGFPNAFQVFCAGRGVEVVVDRIEYEIDYDIEEYGPAKPHALGTTYGQLSVARSATLKHILRSMHRMMQSSGTAEGLRGLIDSSLLKSLTKILDNRALFGPSILALAINITATFVHNEPTCLSVIQEAGVPEALYRALEDGVEPVIEVIQAVPNVLGALCLNQTGQDQLRSRPTILPGLFTIFTSEKHLKVLQDKENAVLVGTAIDELVRHHPGLKDAVFEAIKSTLGRIEQLGQAWETTDELREWYGLVYGEKAVEKDQGKEKEDVVMEDVPPTSAPTPTPDMQQETLATAVSTVEITSEDNPLRAHDNPVVSFIDVFGRFLEGLFQHSVHTKEFITKADGLNALGRFTALPCLPYDFANSVASDSLVQVIRTMAEAATNETLAFLSGIVVSSLESTKDFWESLSEQPKLLYLLDAPSDKQEEAQQVFHRLKVLHTRVTLLSEVYSTAGFGHPRTAVGLQSLLGRSGSGEEDKFAIIEGLGALHRACVWENVALKASFAERGISTKAEGEADGAVTNNNSGDGGMGTPLDEGANGSAAPNVAVRDGVAALTAHGVGEGLRAAGDASADKEKEKQVTKTPAQMNARALKHIVGQMPTALAPFFQAVVKLLNVRRNPDPVQKKHILESAAGVADVLIKHLQKLQFVDKPSTYAYYTVMSGLATILLVDERVHTTVNTVILSAFYRANGLSQLYDIAQLFIHSLSDINAVAVDERTDSQKQELVQAYGGLKVILHLLQLTLSSKPVLEAPQNIILITSDKKKADPAYFQVNDFLVQLRHAALPLIQELWTSSWLVSAPLSVSKSVVQVVLELVSAEGEEPPPDGATTGPLSIPGSSLFRPPTSPPGENRITQLTEMGFPRSAAERALMRMHNNVAAAAELLLAQPFPFRPDPVPAAPTAVVEIAVGPPAPAVMDEDNEGDDEEQANEGEAAEQTVPNMEQATENTEQAAETVATPSDVLAEPSEPEGPTPEDRRKELDTARGPLRDNIGKVALTLVDEHPSLVFEIQSAFIGPADSYRSQSVKQLVDDIKRFSPAAYDLQEQPLAVRCRLLALVMNAQPSQIKDMLGGDPKGLMDVLLALLLSNPNGLEGDGSAVPKWLGAHLLVIESLLVAGEEARSITLPTTEEDPLPSEELLTGPTYAEARTRLFDYCFRLLAVNDLGRDELLSALRLFVLLTHDHSMAKDLIKRDGLLLLFKHLKKTDGDVSAKSYITVILRHIIEDPSTLQQTMQREIKRYMLHPKTRGPDPVNYVRSCSAIALRDPRAFIQATEAVCMLTRPFAITPQIVLKKTTADEKVPEGKEKDPAVSAMQVDEPIAPQPPIAAEEMEAVVHFLISELMKLHKASDAVPSSPDISRMSTQEAAPAEPLTANPSTVGGGATNGQEVDYAQSCFLMQVLTELLFSYESCKTAFLAYSPKKKPQTPSKDSAKHRTTALHFFLHDLIFFGSISPVLSPEARQRVSVCNWAMSVLVALCVDSTAATDLKEASPELASVRKFVLEAVSRAIRDSMASESADTRYSRLLALADLCHRLLTVRFSNPVRRIPEDAPTHIAKVMLEKNFVATLTNALGEVDLNYPHVRNVVTAVLKPLQNLSKIAIRMGRASDKAKSLGEDDFDSGSEMSADSTDEEEDAENLDREDRDDTPDLYRNSALGMFAGEMENPTFGDREDDMDEDDEADEDEEMDFDEETGSEDTSNTDDEEAEMNIDAADAEWRDEEEGEADGLVQNDEDNDEDDEEDDEEEDNEDGDGGGAPEGDMLWQGEDDADDGEDGEEEDLPTNPTLPAELEEADAASEEGGFVDALDFLEARDETGEPQMLDEEAFDFNIMTSGADLFGTIPLPATDFLRITRRDRRRPQDDGMDVLGRTRSLQASATEATTHPLLVEQPVGGGRSQATLARGSRRLSRGIPVNGSRVDILQTIADVMGGSSYDILRELFTRGDGQHIEAIPSELLGSSVSVGGHRHRYSMVPRGPERHARARDGRADGRSFDPLHTVQRWAEEASALHGKSAADRSSGFSNHVSLALLPAAIKEARDARQREEEEAKRREAEAKQKEAEEAEANQSEGKEPEMAGVTDANADLDSGTAAAAAAPAGESVSLPSEAMDASPVLETASEQRSPQQLVGDLMSQAESEQASATTDSRSSPSTDAEMVDAPAGGSSAAVTATSEPAASTSSTEPAQAPQRVTIEIHGNPVDITDTGIDPTFLEALPDDMREEVLNQHVREQRAARVQRPVDSQIDNEFLDALPPELRAELIQQETLEQNRLRQTTTTAAAREPGAPVDIDPASFLASLDPQLRQVVLLDQDEGFIQTLPSHLIAEAAGYRERTPQRHTIRTAPRGAPRPLPPTVRKPAAPRESIQLLDRAQVAVLVRLLLFPEVLKKNLLFKILVNLCENQRTRTDLFNLLITILQDGTGDLAAIDKSFAQMSFRSPKTPVPSAAKTPSKRSGSDYFGALSLPHTDAVPELIAQQCLEALAFIVNATEASSLFFLTEHDVPASLRRSASRKGKGKEKQTSQVHFPIVTLLSLLDRQALLRTPSIMESVVGLLATVTRPLTKLKDVKKNDAAASSATAPLVTASSSASETTAPAPDPAVAAPPTASSAPVATAPTSDVPMASADQPDATKDVPSEDDQSPEEKALLANPPQIPDGVLKLIVNILTMGECSARTFQQSLALIQHLSYMTEAREVIAQELRSRAQELGLNIQADLDELAKALSQAQVDDVTPLTSKLSASSSDQAKLLRVLKTIDYMYSPKLAGASSVDQSSDDRDRVQGIYESFLFSQLWRRLGECLAIIESKSDIEHVAMVLLPLIESLMVVCKYVGSASPSRTARSAAAAASPITPTTPRQSMEELFVSFTDDHRKIMNLMVRNNPSLMSGSFSLLVHNPRVLDFDNKRNYFNQQLHRRPHGREHHGTLQLNVRRARVFEDSFHHLQRKTGDQIKHGKLSIHFYDEEGVDAGGLTREWFQILARQMFDPNYALFQPCVADRLTYQPNRASWVNPEHLSFFKFVGRVIGKAIHDGRLLDAYFARSFYRQLLGKPVDYRDVEWVDPEYYNSLCWILENDPEPLELTFDVEADEFGVTKIIPLKENGTSIPVTMENRKEFVQLSAQYRLYNSIKDQIEAILQGFYEIIPKDLISIFNEQEVELLISGTPDIDVDEWRAATEYNGYTSSEPVIMWWWRALKSFNREERAKVLSFATGTSRVPLGGFSDLQGVQGVQKFSIHRAYGEEDRLPSAHTCFNQIDLPHFSSYEKLRQQLLLAINEGGEGFGFA